MTATKQIKKNQPFFSNGKTQFISFLLSEWGQTGSLITWFRLDQCNENENTGSEFNFRVINIHINAR